MPIDERNRPSEPQDPDAELIRSTGDQEDDEFDDEDDDGEDLDEENTDTDQTI